MDWFFISGHVPDYLSGAWVTLRFGLYGVGCSAVLGLLCTLIRFYRVPVLRAAARIYVELSRNTPLLTEAMMSFLVASPFSIYVALILGMGLKRNDSLRPLPVGATP